MTTYVLRKGKLVEKHLAAPLVANGAPYVISDIMEPTRHMATNRYYTSKAKFRQATKASGCVEIGNDVGPLLQPRKPVRLDPAKRRDDIRRTLYELRNRS